MTLEMFDLSGKVAPITGRRTRLGEGMVNGLADAGADIFGIYNRSKQIKERISPGRRGNPEDLKGDAVFLSSRASSRKHGYNSIVDGGWLAR